MRHQNKRYVKEKNLEEFAIDIKLDSKLCKGFIYGKVHCLKFDTRL